MKYTIAGSYIVVAPRPDLPNKRPDYICAFPDSLNGKWSGGPEWTEDKRKALRMSKRTARRLQGESRHAYIEFVI